MIPNIFGEKFNVIRLVRIRYELKQLQDVEDEEAVAFSSYLNTPACFASISAFEFYFSAISNIFLESPKFLTSYFKENSQQAEIAYRQLDKLIEGTENDEVIDADPIEVMRFVRNWALYSYLLAIEGPFDHFLEILAVHSRESRGASTEGLDIFNKIQELSRISEFKGLSDCYNNVVRNAIAHGTVEFLNEDLVFHSKRNRRELSYREFIHLTDDILDICNAFKLALSTFIHLNRKQLELDSIPEYYLLQNTSELLRNPNWKIVGYLSNTILQNRKQLITYIENQFGAYDHVSFNVLRTVQQVEKSAPDYDRYFLSIRSPKSKITTGYSAFTGSELRKKREGSGFEIGDVAEALEDAPPFFVERFIYRLPLVEKIQRIRILYSERMVARRFIHQLQKLGFLLKIRYTKLHRNGFHSVLDVRAVMLHYEHLDVREIQQIIKDKAEHIYRLAIKEARVNSTSKLHRWLPVGFVRIHMYSRNHRVRHLLSMGLASDYIGYLELKRLKRIKSPALFGGEITSLGKFRFCANAKHSV